MEVILFDGVCNLCNASVDFILRHDPAARFHFAALQSEVGRRILLNAGLPVEGIDALVLWQDGRVYTASDAVLRIACGLRFPWCLLSALIVFPRSWRDATYRWVARYRYRWFGRRDTCRLPTPEEQGRFLEIPPAGDRQT